MLKHPCISWLKPTQSWCIIFLIYVSILLSSFESMFTIDIGIFIFVCLCLVFCFLLCCRSSLKVWQNSDVNLSSPGLIKAGKLFTTTLISSLVMGMFRLLTSWFNFGGFAESISSCISFRFFRVYVFKAFRYDIQNIFGDCYNVSLFISGPVSFFCLVGPRVCQFCLSSQRTRSENYCFFVLFSLFLFH